MRSICAECHIPIEILPEEMLDITKAFCKSCREKIWSEEQLYMCPHGYTDELDCPDCGH